MKEIEKIYTVYNGEVVGVAVVKVTKKLVFVDAPKEFYYAIKLNRHNVCINEKEAVMEELNRCLTRVGMYRDRLEKEKKRLQHARDLAVEVGRPTSEIRVKRKHGTLCEA